MGRGFGCYEGSGVFVSVSLCVQRPTVPDCLQQTLEGVRGRGILAKAKGDVKIIMKYLLFPWLQKVEFIQSKFDLLINFKFPFKPEE